MKTATQRRSALLISAVLLILAGLAWSFRHIHSMLAVSQGEGGRFAVVFTFAFVMLAWTMLLCYLEKPKVIDDSEKERVDALRIVANVPVYNEDPAALQVCLQSMLNQTRKIDIISVIDDGSTAADYTEVEAWFRREASARGQQIHWERQPNAGKRHAQGLTFTRFRTDVADVYLTVDSDAELDVHAIEEAIKPFSDRRVTSVAGIVLAAKNQMNLLSRVTDLWFVVGQLVDRSALSTMGSVLVNSGPLAMYRADVVQKYLHVYLNETFFGRRVEFSDDSMLTIFALSEGRAVQQPTAYAFTLMPENFNHHVRQYVRWMRGAFIRSFWRFKYLPLKGYAFWGHLIGWMQMILGLFIFVALFVVQPFIDASVIPYFLIVPLLISYGQALRYLQVKRSDQTLGSQLVTFALTPIASLWAFFGLRFVRYYAMATCLRTGWGTRETVEVTADVVDVTDKPKLVVAA